MGKNQYFLTKIASARHWIANFIVTRAGLVAVDSILARLAGPIAAKGERQREKTRLFNVRSRCKWHRMLTTASHSVTH